MSNTAGSAGLRQRNNPHELAAESAVRHGKESQESDTCQTAFSWTDPRTWSASLQLAPVPIALIVTFIWIYANHFANKQSLITPRYLELEACRRAFDYTFNVNAVVNQTERLASHDWEYGTAAEALLELLDPERTVFAQEPFPADKVRSLDLRKPKPILWVQHRIRTSSDTLFENEWGVSDPASLGIPAILLGQRNPKYLQAAMMQTKYLLNTAPRYSNEAISHRTKVAELWSDAISMVPPFLAFYAVAGSDLDIMKEAVSQCGLYREVLMITEGAKKGLWKHIVGPSEMADEGVWSTGAGWATYGMTRVRATITGWGPSNETLSNEKRDLDRWIAEILDGAIRTDDHKSGLLRNYLGDDDWFGETSGTALLAAAAYRMAVLSPDIFAQPAHLAWADRKRRTVLELIDKDGFVYPAANPLKHTQREPVRDSPEGESFLLMLASAWRDCVCSGICTR